MKAAPPSLLAATLPAAAGALTWLAYLRIAKLAAIHVWDPIFGSPRPDLTVLELCITAVPVVVSVSALIALRQPNRWWRQWLGFLIGVSLCIAAKTVWQTHDFELARSVLSNGVFITFVLGSLATFWLVKLSMRSNNRWRGP